MDDLTKHYRIAADRASTNPEVATANALVAIADELREIRYTLTWYVSGGAHRG